MPEPVDISPNKTGGVLKEILKEGVGDGTVPGGCLVKVHYTGTLLDGTKFDCSRDRNKPFEFNLGKGSVIKAWDIGVATMKKGEQAILTCAPEFAYGESGSPPNIPPNATLKFDVEVIEWKGEDVSSEQDGSIEKFTITPGDGFTTPNDGALVQVHYVGKYEGEIIEERDVSFCIGEGSEEGVIGGIEIALEKFKKGETARLVISPKHSYGSRGWPEKNVPADVSVEYVVTLKSFEKVKDSWALDAEERIAQAKTFKEKGTEYFKKSKWALAGKFYKKAIEYIKGDISLPERKEERDEVILSSQLNLALVSLKINDFYEAIQWSKEVLKVDPQNVKAHFRLGQALLETGEPKLASEEFAECLKLDPNNKAAEAQRALSLQTLREQLRNERKIYANMFDKFAKTDTQVNG